MQPIQQKTVFIVQDESFHKTSVGRFGMCVRTRSQLRPDVIISLSAWYCELSQLRSGPSSTSM